MFISQLYNKLNIPRSTIQSIIESVRNFFSSGIIGVIKNLLQNICKFENMALKDVFNMLDILENPFQSLNMEYKRFKYFRENHKFIQPIEQVIGVSEERKRQNKEIIMSLEKQVCSFVPMRKVLKQFLELPGVFQTILHYQENLEKSSHSHISNIVQGQTWINLKKKLQKRR